MLIIFHHSIRLVRIISILFIFEIIYLQTILLGLFPDYYFSKIFFLPARSLRL